MATEKITVTTVVRQTITEEYEISLEEEDFIEAVGKAIEERHPGTTYGIMKVEDQFGQSLWE